MVDAVIAGIGEIGGDGDDLPGRVDLHQEVAARARERDVGRVEVGQLQRVVREGRPVDRPDMRLDREVAVRRSVDERVGAAAIVEIAGREHVVAGSRLQGCVAVLRCDGDVARSRAVPGLAPDLVPVEGRAVRQEDRADPSCAELIADRDRLTDREDGDVEVGRAAFAREEEIVAAHLSREDELAVATDVVDDDIVGHDRACGRPAASCPDQGAPAAGRSREEVDVVPALDGSIVAVQPHDRIRDGAGLGPGRSLQVEISEAETGGDDLRIARSVGERVGDEEAGGDGLDRPIAGFEPQPGDDRQDLVPICGGLGCPRRGGRRERRRELRGVEGETVGARVVTEGCEGQEGAGLDALRARAGQQLRQGHLARETGLEGLDDAPVPRLPDGGSVMPVRILGVFGLRGGVDAVEGVDDGEVAGIHVGAAARGIEVARVRPVLDHGLEGGVERGRRHRPGIRDEGLDLRQQGRVLGHRHPEVRHRPESCEVGEQECVGVVGEARRRGVDRLLAVGREVDLRDLPHGRDRAGGAGRVEREGRARHERVAVHDLVRRRGAQPDGRDAEGGQRVQLALPGLAVPVRVRPDPQARIGGVPAVDDAVPVRVERPEVAEAVAGAGAEKLGRRDRPVVQPVVEDQQPHAGPDPARMGREAVGVEIEMRVRPGQGRELDSGPREVQHQRVRRRRRRGRKARRRDLLG